MANVYISLGTNLGNKQNNLEKALLLLQLHAGMVEQKSTIYETQPWGFESFNNFLNQVALISTALHPKELLQTLLTIEQFMGRQRVESGYSDRIIDLDILLYDDLVLHTETLEIPHPRLHERIFMLAPLAEINQNLLHPKLQKPMAVLLRELEETLE